MTLEARKYEAVSNAAKVADVLNIQGNPFVKEDVHNLVTFAVMPKFKGQLMHIKQGRRLLVIAGQNTS